MTLEADKLRFGGAAYVGEFDGETAFSKMYDGFREAMRLRRNLCNEFHCTFAGLPARFRIVGQKLAEIIALPFSHLHTKNSCAENLSLKVDLWDENETGVPCPADSLQTEDISRADAEYCFVKSSPDSRFIGFRRPRMTTLFDRAAQHLAGCISDSESLSFFERGKPLHLPLLLWHLDRDVPVIHSGLVSKNDKGALFVGKGDSGKTTAALSCLAAGFDYLGDDYIGLQVMQDGSFVGHSLYGSAWIMADHSERFPRLNPYLIESQRPDQEKSLIHLSEVFPRNLARTARICAVLLPGVRDMSDLEVRRVTKKEALLALAPSSMIFLPNSGSATLNKLAELVERVPCYRLETGRNLEDIPRRVKEILGTVL